MSHIQLTSGQWFVQTVFVRKVWPKLLVSFLLLWTAVDISLPILVCNSEAMLSLDVGPGLTLPSSSSSRQESRQDSGESKYRYEDDCFCCCSHIVPTAHVNLVAVLRSAPAQIRLTSSAPEARPRTLFHPPRS